MPFNCGAHGGSTMTRAACEYLEQVNQLTETFVFNDGAYWGDPSTNKNPYVKGVTYDFAQEISTDSDRLVRTTVTLETIAELLPKYATNKPNIDKSKGPHCRTDVKSGIVIDKAPFNFKFQEKKVLMKIKRADRYITTVLYVNSKL